MRGDVRCLVVAEREAVVAAAARGETVVALDPAGIPPVTGDPMFAAAVRVRLGGRRRQMARHQALVLGVGVVLVLAPADVEAVAVLGAAGVEIRSIGAQPTEVVVEGPVLHDEHHDGVDRRVRRRAVEQPVCTERSFRGAVAFVVAACREQRTERRCAGAERARLQELPSVHLREGTVRRGTGRAGCGRARAMIVVLATSGDRGGRDLSPKPWRHLDA